MNSQTHYSRLSKVYPVSRETFERLELFVARLLEWQKKTNLVAPSTLDDIWNRHIADSLQLIALQPDARSWVDIGSGGGLPGLVITAVMTEHDASEVHMIESIQKKCSFLRQVNRQIKGTAKVHCARIEEIAQSIKAPEVVTARALSALPDLLELSSPWLTEGAIGLFHKGREFEAELRDCDGLWSFDLVNHESVISSDSVILEISNLKRLGTR